MGSRYSEGLVSIIMPAYNAERFISKAIESVLEQTYQNWELLIIDDASTDATPAIIGEYAARSERIKVHRQKRNQGVAVARNVGLELAGGELIAFLDADDIWQQEKLTIQNKIFDQNKKNICATAYNIIDANDDFVKERRIPEVSDFEGLLRDNTVIFSSSMFRHRILENVRFDPNYYHEDFVFLLELLRRGERVYGLNEVLVQYRVQKAGRSFNKWRAARHRWQIYRSFCGFGVLRSLWYFWQYAINGLRKYSRL